MKITLLFPPHWAPYQPYLSLPSLTGFLREKGYTVTQKDINIECADYFTSTKGLKDASEKIKNRMEYLRSLENMTEDEEAEFKRLSSWESVRDDLIRSVRGAKKLLKDRKNFFNFDIFRNASIVLLKAYQMMADAYYPTFIDFYYLGQKYPSCSTRGIIEAVRDKEGNLYVDYFKKFTIPSLLEEPSDFYGISITDFSQTIPGITLARMLKEAFPKAHICIGGNAFTRMGHKLLPSSQLFEFFDSIILYEGETALLALLKALEKGENFQNIPNIIYKDTKGEIIFNERVENPDINSLPPPDFDGLPLENYFSPFIILPLLSARGCYWNKCTFCQHKYNYHGSYRPRKIEKIMADIEVMHKKYDCKYFSFNDEAIPPFRLGEIARKITGTELDICWEAHARAEKNFDNDLTGVLFASGCRMLSFGLESSCARILDLMNKGIDIDVFEKILGYSAERGIWNHVWFFTGFPTETEEEARETIDFILRNQDKIHSVPFNVVFGLEEDTDIIKNPHKYDLKDIKPLEGNDLSFVYDYSVTRGLSSREAEKLATEFQERLIREHRQGIFIYTMTAVHRMLYVDHYGTNDLAKKLFEVG